MAEARCRNNWTHTSTILAHLANVNRYSRRARLFKPAEFNPYERRRPKGIPLIRDNLKVLKQVFVDRKEV
jgi:hypothetical protein